MPYYRRYSKYRRYRRNPRYRFTSRKQISRTVNKVRKWLKKPEIKSTNLSHNNTPDNADFKVQHVIELTQGAGEDERIGNQVKLFSVQIRGRIVINASATQTFVRIALILDNAADGDYLNGSQIWNYVSSGVYIDAIRRSDYNTRIKVLTDRVYHLDSTNKKEVFFTIYKKLSAKVEFSGTSSALSDIVKNNLMLYTVSNEPTNAPTVYFNTKLSYTDV